jgi:hypothetical protein
VDAGYAIPSLGEILEVGWVLQPGSLDDNENGTLKCS